MPRFISDLPVKDARKSLTIDISHGDVMKGRTKNPGSCAAAQACKRQVKCTEVRVHLGRTYLKMGDHWVRYCTPQSLRSEIIAFDRGANFSEGEYTLRAPKGKEKLGSGHSGTNTNRTRPKHLQKQRAAYHVVTGVRPFLSAKELV